MMTASASCTLDSLSACAKEHQLFSPAIVVISGTAALYDPPGHLRVGLCGSDALNQKLKDLLPASVQYQQLLKVRYHDLPLPDDLFDSGLPQWIVLTSAHGIHVLMREFQRLHIDHRKLANTRFALIGRQSARVLESYGIFADLVASPSSSQSLLETLKPELAEGDRVFLAQSRQAIDVLSRGLQEISSITVLEHPLYEVTFESSSMDFLPAKVKTIHRPRKSFSRRMCSPFPAGNVPKPSCAIICSTVQNVLLPFRKKLPIFWKMNAVRERSIFALPKRQMHAAWPKPLKRCFPDPITYAKTQNTKTGNTKT